MVKGPNDRKNTKNLDVQIKWMLNKIQIKWILTNKSPMFLFCPFLWKCDGL